MPFLITVASTTVKDLFSKVDGLFSVSLPLASSPFLFFIVRPRCPPSLTPTPEPISPLQIGLVILRVHQDNSGLALCPFQENAANGGGGGSGVMGRKGGAASRTYCTDAARGLCFGLFEICGASRSPSSLSPSLFFSLAVTHWISARSVL